MSYQRKHGHDNKVFFYGHPLNHCSPFNRQMGFFSVVNKVIEIKIFSVWVENDREFPAFLFFKVTQRGISAQCGNVKIKFYCTHIPCTVCHVGCVTSRLFAYCRAGSEKHSGITDLIRASVESVAKPLQSQFKEKYSEIVKD